MNFRAVASRVTAAARKIPTFDDMAAKDDYIHSEEFNVRGKKRGILESSSSSTAAAAATKNNATTPAGGVVDPDETSSMGSWSLLDRPPVHLRSPGALASRDKLEISSAQGSLQGGVESTTTMSANTSVSSEAPSQTQQRRLSHSSSSLPLLSVVANTWESSVPNSNRAGRDDPTDMGVDALDSGESDSSQTDDDDSMDSEVDDDEDDPIMSMIRNSKPPSTSNERRRRRRRTSKSKGKVSIGNKTAIASSSPGGNSSQRFMQDLDERISSAGGGEERMESGLLPVPSPPLTSEPTTAVGFKGPFGGWLQNAAKAQFDLILRRPETSPAVVGNTISTSQKKAQAPLARERTPKAKALKSSPADDFQRAASSSFMGDEELAQLAKLKGSSNVGTCSVLVGMVREYQNFAFIIFTLILAMFVYYFQRSADDVS